MLLSILGPSMVALMTSSAPPRAMSSTERPKRSIRTVLRGKAKVAAGIKERLSALQTDTTTVEGVRKLAKSGRLPEHVRKLIEGYDLRCYWFELFECARKILLVGMPVFFEMGSVAQLTYGLLVCFVSFGAFTLLKPYANDSDDRLAMLCQVQIFFALLAAVILRWNSAAGAQTTSINLDAILCVFAALPTVFAALVHALEEGLYEYFYDCFNSTRTWVQSARQNDQQHPLDSEDHDDRQSSMASGLSCDDHGNGRSSVADDADYDDATPRDEGE